MVSKKILKTEKKNLKKKEPNLKNLYIMKQK
jgi:hypothetical protein